jgi:hypothetical protein
MYINLLDLECVQVFLQDTRGQDEYKHTNWEISRVRIDMTGIGTRKTRIANLPPGVDEETLGSTISPCGKIIAIKEETWSLTYGYSVANGMQ